MKKGVDKAIGGVVIYASCPAERAPERVSEAGSTDFENDTERSKTEVLRARKRERGSEGTKAKDALMYKEEQRKDS